MRKREKNWSSVRNSESLPAEDDGKTIADMNVEGMPWYRPPQSGTPEGGERIELNSEEGRAAMWGALKAALLVAAVFAVGFLLFLLFCDKIWLK